MLPHAIKFTHRASPAQTGRHPAGRTNGLALFEVLMLIAIIGIIGAVAVTSILSRPDPAQIATARQEIRTLDAALQNYARDNGEYPTTTQGLGALVTRPVISPVPRHWQPYLDTLPLDPWGNPYQYQYPGTHGRFDVWSYGPGGPAAMGSGSGVIGNWNLQADAQSGTHG